MRYFWGRLTIWISMISKGISNSCSSNSRRIRIDALKIAFQPYYKKLEWKNDR